MQSPLSSAVVPSSFATIAVHRRASGAHISTALCSRSRAFVEFDCRYCASILASACCAAPTSCPNSTALVDPPFSAEPPTCRCRDGVSPARQAVRGRSASGRPSLARMVPGGGRAGGGCGARLRALHHTTQTERERDFAWRQHPPQVPLALPATSPGLPALVSPGRQSCVYAAHHP